MACEGCDYTFLSTYDSFKSVDQVIAFLVKHGCVLPVERWQCPRCLSTLHYLKTRNRWTCMAQLVDKNNRKWKRCTFTRSRFSGTWLERAKLKPQTNLLMVSACLMRMLNSNFAERELKVSQSTFTDWSNFICEVCITDLMEHSEKIGGPGKTVEIGEWNLGKKKKGKQQEAPASGKWMIAGSVRGTHEIFFTTLPDCKLDNLLMAIEKHIAPGTLVVSEIWKRYKDLRLCSHYQQLTAKSLIKFVDPQSGQDTQSIERVWRDAENAIPCHGRHPQHLQSYLALHLWIRKHTNDTRHLHDFFIAVSKIFIPSIT